MTEKELILLFKKEHCMTESDWIRFCRRYAGKELFPIVNHIRSRHQDIVMPHCFKEYLKKEIENVQKVSAH